MDSVPEESEAEVPPSRPSESGSSTSGRMNEAASPWERARTDFFSSVRRVWGSRKFETGVLWVSRLALALVLLAYVRLFVLANTGMLFDADLQNDDARTILFPFHQYGSQGTLGDDPIASEMLSAVPWGVRALYVILVPLVDVFVAAKIVQILALGLLGWAATVLIRSRRTGWAAGALLIFLMLHTPFAMDRIAGGLPRAFGFPCFALWIAGVLAGRKIPRIAAPILLSLTYPSVMNLILAAEGLFALRGAGRNGWRVMARRLRRYAVLVGVCLVCVLPAAVGSADRGPIHTLKEAQKEPAFGRSGRLHILPFAEPMKAMGKALLDPVAIARPKKSEKAFTEALRREPILLSTVFLGLILLIPILRWGAVPRMAISFLIGAVIVYAASRVLAFRLYSPERYYSFGMRMAAMGLVLSIVSQAWFWLKRNFREIARNGTTLCVVVLLWGFGGERLKENTGMVIDRKDDAELYAFVRGLPKDVRFATHILDGDGIPLFGARAHMGSYETLQPWFVDSWARQKVRAMDTQEAMYATERQVVLSYVKKHGVTHFLVNKVRLGKRAKRKSGSFQPFSKHVRGLLRKKKNRQLLFSSPPKDSIVFQKGRFRIVSVEKLVADWAKNPEKQSEPTVPEKKPDGRQRRLSNQPRSRPPHKRN